MFEFFEHTADLGLRIRANSREDLFADAARALMNALMENPESVLPAELFEIQVAGDDLSLLFFDWLNELLYRFEAEGLLCREFHVHFGPGGLTATVKGEQLDRSRHTLAHEVKAITYHGLRVEQSADGWLAEVIVDI